MDNLNYKSYVNVCGNFVSYNCKSLKRSTVCIQELCKTADVIALQETWLLPNEVSLLGNIDVNFGFFGKSAVDTSAGILRGRPYGGTAILWRKSVFTSVTVIPCMSDRIAAVKMTCADRTLLLFSVYMPTDSHNNLNEFCECLGEIAAIVESVNVEYVYILGDFNAHPGELFNRELLSFCVEQSWICADYEKLGIDSDTYTFVSEVCGSRRWLDHLLVSEMAWKTLKKVEVYHDIYWSDHFPLSFQVDLGMVGPGVASSLLVTNKNIDKAIWGERNVLQRDCYYELCMEKLRNIDFPSELGKCCDLFCQDVSHRSIIDHLYVRLVTSLREAAEGSSGSVSDGKRRRAVIGWNKYVREAHGDARKAFLNWVWHGRPRNGRVYEEMNGTRKVFKQRLKYCQDNEDQIKMNMLATEHGRKHFQNFWKSTQRLNPKPSVPVRVGGVEKPEEIADMFRRHFAVAPVQVEEQVRVAGDIMSGEPINISAREIKDIIKSMTRGKSPGHDGLSIEHFQYAGPHLPRILSMFFNFCVRHSYLPVDLMRTIVVPIVKSKTKDASDKDNYRPISLATVTAKVLDRVFERRISAQLKPHDAQFGFRAGLSTETAILALKHTVKYYTDRNTPVYAAFLDLSKAFDLVNYNILWSKLRQNTIPQELVNLLEFWYNHQINQVRWSGALSGEYGLECGVRQGGLTSPGLFSLYVNQLVEELGSTGVGCSIDGKVINSISYADDMVLLSPSIDALRRLLGVCEQYATAHGLLYNVRKSEVMVFRVGSRKPKSVPPVFLYGEPLKRVSQFKYLGHVLNENLSDDDDLERERRALSVRCNMLARRFARCTKEVKITLFKAYCQTFYTCSLWIKYTQKAYNALRIQYNNAFRVLLGLPRFCSASGMFAEAGIDSFEAIMRKRAASLMRRIRGSPNSILSVIAERPDCPFLAHWSRRHACWPGAEGKFMN